MVIVMSYYHEQPVEIQVTKFELIGTCEPATYPMAKKMHTLDHLRLHQNLRMRTNIVSVFVF